MIGTVDEIGERGSGCAGSARRAVREIAAPVTTKIPVGTGDVGHVDVNHHAELLGGHARFLNATKTETKTAAHGANNMGFRVGKCAGVADFGVKRIAVGEGDDNRVIFGIARGLREVAVFHAVGGEESKLTNFEIAGGGDDVANGGRIGDGNNVELGDVRVAAEAHAVVDGIVRRRSDDGKFHAFLKTGIAARIEVDGSVGHIFHVEDGGLGMGLGRRRSWSWSWSSRERRRSSAI